MPPPRIFDISQFNFDEPIFGIDDIRRVNPQRHEMEQLTGVVYVDRENHGIVGFKDVTDKEFWIAGHMPGFPLMPGVILCECIAQLASFYALKYKLFDGGFLGFGGMDNVRFRGPVFPNCRLVLAVRSKRFRPNRRAEFVFQGFVEDRMVVSGEMIGVPITRDQKID